MTATTKCTSVNLLCECLQGCMQKDKTKQKKPKGVDGELKIWQQSDWTLVKTINKNLGRECQVKNDEKTNRQMFLARPSFSPDARYLGTSYGKDDKTNVFISQIYDRDTWERNIAYVGHTRPTTVTLWNPRLFIESNWKMSEISPNIHFFNQKNQNNNNNNNNNNNVRDSAIAKDDVLATINSDKNNDKTENEKDNSDGKKIKDGKEEKDDDTQNNSDNYKIPSCVCAIGGMDSNLSIWATHSNTPLFVLQNPFNQTIMDISWSPTGFLFFTMHIFVFLLLCVCVGCRFPSLCVFVFVVVM